MKAGDTVFDKYTNALLGNWTGRWRKGDNGADGTADYLEVIPPGGSVTNPNFILLDRIKDFDPALLKTSIELPSVVQYNGVLSFEVPSQPDKEKKLAGGSIAQTTTSVQKADTLPGWLWPLAVIIGLIGLIALLSPSED